MRFFTPAWCIGDLTDEEASAAPARYALHLDGLPLMPAPVYALARGINIHDGLIRRLRVERATNTVIALLRCGDNQVGYFDLEIGYLGVQFDRSELQRLGAIARDPKSEALYDEIDYNSEGHWIHRVLFWPYQEVSITFQTLRIAISPTASREFDRLSEPYEEDTVETAPPNQPSAADAARR